LNELEYVEGLIYANVWQNAHIAIIDPQNGVVVGWLNLNWLNVVHSPIDGADVLNGIAYDPATRRLFITGKLWPTLYAFALPSLEDT
jgi:glutamine cyclotransferase